MISKAPLPETYLNNSLGKGFCLGCSSLPGMIINRLTTGRGWLYWRHPPSEIGEIVVKCSPPPSPLPPIANRRVAFDRRCEEAESEERGRAMAAARNLMAEVTRDYELCMSALVFDSNMMNEANIQVGGRGKSCGVGSASWSIAVFMRR